MILYSNYIKHMRPISDLEKYFENIYNQVHNSNESVFLTKDGSVDMVILSMKAYENLEFDNEVYCKLKEAEKEYKANGKTYTPEQVLKELKLLIPQKHRVYLKTQ